MTNAAERTAISKRRQTDLGYAAASLWRNRSIVKQLARRDVEGRYRGSILGIAWSLIHPIVMLGVYTFVFSVVFRMKWGSSGGESRLEFAIVLFCGMIVFGIFAECLNRAPQLIISQPNFVKKIVFPLEVLPWVPAISAAFHAGIGVMVLVALILVSGGRLHATLLFLPVVLMPLLFISMGLAWFLSALAVYIRDVGQIVGMVVTVLMFLSPLFYPAAAIPQSFRSLVMLNPVSIPIEQAREVVIWGRVPDWSSLGWYAVASLIVMWAGFAWFQRSRNGFADVI